MSETSILQFPSVTSEPPDNTNWPLSEDELLIQASTISTENRTPGQPSLSGQATPRILSGADYTRLPTAPEAWLVEPVLPSGGSLLLYGDPKVGKSFAALQLACALSGAAETSIPQSLPNPHAPAPHTEWLSFLIPRPARTVYIQLDTPRSLWSSRIVALHAAGFPTDRVLFGDRETLDCFPFSILDPIHRSILQEALAEQAPDVVVIDTLREVCTGADENSSNDMQEVIAYLTAACQPAALVLVAHGKKPPSEGEHSVVSGNRGSSYITGKMDAICHFSTDSMTVIGRACEEQKFGLEKVEIPGGFYWTLNRRERETKLASDLLANGSFQTLRAKAREFSRLTGRPEPVAMSILRRASGQPELTNEEI